MTDVLVLHDVGDPAGGAPWAEAFSDAGWSGAVHAPDLPGHAGEAPPLGGSYNGADPALTGALVVAGLPAGGPPPVVVGVRASGWGAQLLALGGRAAALVLVDGLGGPWLDGTAAVAADRAWLRRLADDPEAVGPAPPGAPLDPRLRHGVPPQADRGLAMRAAAAVPVPVLVLHTGVPGTGPLADGEADDLSAAFRRSDVVRLGPPASLPEVARVVVEWTRRESL